MYSGTLAFRRSISHYLSDRFLSAPFSVGYPVASATIQQQILAIRHTLFEPIHIDQDAVKGMSAYERASYEDALLRKKPKLSTPAPQALSGFRLYRHGFGVTKDDWDSLTHEQQQVFSNADFVQTAWRERTRVWQGNEIVRYLKSSAECDVENPYVYLGLFPWEIIRQKLQDTRKRARRFALELDQPDYYDRLIKETFSAKKRTPMHLFYANVKRASLGSNIHLSYARVQRLYNTSLNDEQRQFYDAMAARRREFQTRNAVKGVGAHAFMSYARELIQNGGVPPAGSYHERVAHAAALWKQLSAPEKQRYMGGRLPAVSRAVRMSVREHKLRLVLEYIYDVGGTVDTPADYDWEADMRRQQSWHDLPFL